MCTVYMDPSCRVPAYRHCVSCFFFQIAEPQDTPLQNFSCDNLDKEGSSPVMSHSVCHRVVVGTGLSHWLKKRSGKTLPSPFPFSPLPFPSLPSPPLLRSRPCKPARGPPMATNAFWCILSSKIVHGGNIFGYLS